MRLQTLSLGSVWKVRLSARPSAIMCSLLLWALYSALGGFLFKLPPDVAIVGGFLALVLHWFSELMHQFGHVWAGRRLGHAATGIQLWWVFSSTLYPTDEPALPTAIHLRRALGGPALSLLLTIVAAILFLVLLPVGGFAWRLAAVFTLQNLLVFTIGFLPLGFTDGSTLLRLRSARLARGEGNPISSS
jgi:hypothetical protein